jgi:hypothetical protein
VPPNDIAAYEAAIMELADDAEQYSELQHRSEQAGRRFLDERTSFKAALEHTLSAIARGERVSPLEISCVDRETRPLQSSCAAV